MVSEALNDLYYLAGLIDGEGSIGYFSKGSGRECFQIEIKMTDEPVIDWIIENFGGYKQLRFPAKPHHKMQYRWRVQGQKALALYNELKNILKIKSI